MTVLSVRSMLDVPCTVDDKMEWTGKNRKKTCNFDFMNKNVYIKHDYLLIRWTLK